MRNDIHLLNELWLTTTVVRIDDFQTFDILEESMQESDQEPQFLQNKVQTDFNALETHWENKWQSFGDSWTNERQMFRYLWYETRSFFESFKVYKESFHKSLSLTFERDPISRSIMLNEGLRSELAVRAMYEYGKQAIDLLHELLTFNQEIYLLLQDQETNIFLQQFKETRNKFLIHYFDPHQFPNWIFDTNYYSVMGTGQYLECNIHVRNQIENRYVLHINHYADYFKLEEILVDLIRGF